MAHDYQDYQNIKCPVFNGKQALCSSEPPLGYLLPSLISLMGSYLSSCIIFRIIEKNKKKYK